MSTRSPASETSPSEVRTQAEPDVAVDISKALPEVMHSILRRAQEDLLALSEDDLLTKRWWFRYDDERSARWNLYEFSKAIDSYRRDCRSWEEHYNGGLCVVERVRDKYLMPKISEFLAALERTNPDPQARDEPDQNNISNGGK